VSGPVVLLASGIVDECSSRTRLGWLVLSVAGFAGSVVERLPGGGGDGFGTLLGFEGSHSLVASLRRWAPWVSRGCLCGFVGLITG
jgi:hypothetical protein